MDRRRSKLKTWFRVLDARDYKDIATIELERPIFDLAIDTKSSLLSVVEGRYLDSGSFNQDDAVCRLYDIGRRKPSEDDSDVEDAHDESDTLDDDEYDDESESSGGEESDDEDEDDEDDEDEYGTDYLDSDEEYDEMDEVDASGEGEDETDDDQNHGSFDGSGLSNREIRFLFELPEDEYYEMHGQYSSEEEDDEDDEE